MEQITQEQAIALAESGAWKEWDDEQIASFQLFQKYLAVPFSRFHEAMTKTLGRDIWTHEFADIKRIQDEFLKLRPAPSFQEILEQIPAEKRIVV